MLNPGCRTMIAGCLVLLLATSSLPAAENETPVRSTKLDLSSLQAIPILHKGRAMPFQTFSLWACEEICGWQNPKLDPLQELGSEAFDSDEYAKARELFPGGKARRWKASELVFSWMVEPSTWENIPFILAEHEQLREALELPAFNEAKLRLRFVSPQELDASEKFKTALADLRSRRMQAAQSQQAFESHGLDAMLLELENRFALYKRITANSLRDSNPENYERYLKHLKQCRESVVTLSDFIEPMMGQEEDQSKLRPILQSILTNYQKLEQLAGGGSFEVTEIEPFALRLSADSQALADHFAEKRDKLSTKFSHLSDEKLNEIKKLFSKFTNATSTLARNAHELTIALYDNNDPIRVAPALNLYALEADRSLEENIQPWVGLRMLLYGSKDVLKDYPHAAIDRARAQFFAMSESYVSTGEDRAEKFAGSSSNFLGALRDLADQISEKREKLVGKSADENQGRFDEALIEHTLYPSQTAIATETHYNNAQPFRLSWIISLLAATCFLLAFGVLRKPMFWVGMALFAMGMLWTIYAFYLRVTITSWAPVTNMYETVVYVPLFVSILGIWFILLPLTWTGLQASWRMSAIPGSWEATELTGEQLALMSKQSWSNLCVVASIARAALTVGTFYILGVAKIYDGGNVALDVLPAVSFSHMLSNPNELIVRFVTGLVLLASSWYIPRLVITAVATVVFIPLSLVGRFKEQMQLVYPRWPFALAATLMACLCTYIAWHWPVPGKHIGPLTPVLRSNFWLTIHVITIVSSYGAGLLSLGLANIGLLYLLFGKYRKPVVPSSRSLPKGMEPASHSDHLKPVSPRPAEEVDALANYCYRAMQVAVILLAAGTILGGLWADVSWGRFWGWDPKEVFALISLLVYLAILHGRYAGFFGNFGLFAGAVLGASAIVFSWYGVNFVLGTGLHSYGFGQGGQVEIGLLVFVNWLLLGAAGGRYLVATKPVLPEPADLPASIIPPKKLVKN